MLKNIGEIFEVQCTIQAPPVPPGLALACPVLHDRCRSSTIAARSRHIAARFSIEHVFSRCFAPCSTLLPHNSQPYLSILLIRQLFHESFPTIHAMNTDRHIDCAIDLLPTCRETASTSSSSYSCIDWKSVRFKH